MILVTDVYYEGSNAVAAGLLFKDWNKDRVERELIKNIQNVAAYEPGAFYKRELPCILSLLNEIENNLDMIVIDGCVTLGEDKKGGLGMHLYNAINREVPVIGVAKSEFTGTPPECRIFRGKSRNPLYVTSVGIPLERAKNHILSMHGENRLPTLLKQVDRLCRGTTD
ncbi:MAG: endonuclease V [Proteobacteria bacterium]|nr:endonuclease V [Pseudomonadota bacterium]